MATIYGDNTILDDIRTALKGLMDALKMAMDVAETEPGLTAIYDSHEQAYMLFPAVSIGITDANILAKEAGHGQAGTISLPMNMLCEIRIHTDYQGGCPDRVKCWQLLNSVSNYIKTNGRDYLRDNLTGFLALNFAPSEFEIEAESFDESLSIGGAFRFIVQVVFSHTQV